MKKLLVLCALVALTTGVANAKKSQKEIATTRFTTNIDCPNCTKKVMNVIPFEKGVKDVKVDLETKQIIVSYDKSKTTSEAIAVKIEKIDVKVLKAE